MSSRVTSDPMAILDDPDASVAQVAGTLNLLDKTNQELPIQHWGIVSNITLSILELFMRKYGYLSDVRLNIQSGSYDNYINDIKEYSAANVDHIILVAFFDNIQPSFEAQIPNLSSTHIDEVRSRFFEELKLVLSEAKLFKTILISNFHRYSKRSALRSEDKVSDIIHAFNQDLIDVGAEFSNVQIISTEQIVEHHGRHKTFDGRFYFQGKAPYTAAAQNSLAQLIHTATGNFGSQYSKAILLDCDGTLWGGIIGEDGINGIKLDPYEYPGNIYWRVQQTIIEMARNGALICLCSKNEETDVDEVFTEHAYMSLKLDMVTVKKVNWEDKVTNIEAIAKELNIGLDSMLFIDDSQFECAEVMMRLPAVRTYCVPKNLSDYPQMIDDLASLFSASGENSTPSSKAKQYKIRAQAQKARKSFATHEEFLASLEMKVEIKVDSHQDAPRIAELSQKTNQFNLTTIRYALGGIETVMNDDNACVYSLKLSDKFGQHGLTAAAVLQFSNGNAEVKSFFLSCRILGRSIEIAFWNYILFDAKRKGCRTISAFYTETAKNGQVEFFYDKRGLLRSGDTRDKTKTYENEIELLEMKEKPWLEIVNCG